MMGKGRGKPLQEVRTTVSVNAALTVDDCFRHDIPSGLRLIDTGDRVRVYRGDSVTEIWPGVIKTTVPLDTSGD